MYATQQDIEDRYGKDALLVVADADFDDQIDTEKVSKALNDATDEINLYVGKRERLPLPVVPTILNRLAVDIAFYFLSAEDGYTEEKRQRYDDAKKTLVDIASGKVSLGLQSDSPDIVSPVAMEVEISSEERLFKRSNNNRLF